MGFIFILFLGGQSFQPNTPVCHHRRRHLSQSVLKAAISECSSVASAASADGGPRLPQLDGSSEDSTALNRAPPAASRSRLFGWFRPLHVETASAGTVEARREGERSAVRPSRRATNMTKLVFLCWKHQWKCKRKMPLTYTYSFGKKNLIILIEMQTFGHRKKHPHCGSAALRRGGMLWCIGDRRPGRCDHV